MATILIVDDDADNREVLGRFLSRDGHVIVYASNGKSAIETLSSETPSLVILDIRMPGMDGIEFLRVIRSYRRWRTLPVIVLSGLPDEDRERAAPHGVRHVLQKGSLDFNALRRIVNDALGSTAVSAPAPS
jgi:CheY-like chemotaxis protein